MSNTSKRTQDLSGTSTMTPTDSKDQPTTSNGSDAELDWDDLIGQDMSAHEAKESIKTIKAWHQSKLNAAVAEALYDAYQLVRAAEYMDLAEQTQHQTLGYNRNITGLVSEQLAALQSQLKNQSKGE